MHVLMLTKLKNTAFLVVAASLSVLLCLTVACHWLQVVDTVCNEYNDVWNEAKVNMWPKECISQFIS